MTTDDIRPNGDDGTRADDAAAEAPRSWNGWPSSSR